MPSGGASALNQDDWDVVQAHYDNAVKLGLPHEWLRWFVGGLTNEKMSVRDAAFAATIEWDL